MKKGSTGYVYFDARNSSGVLKTGLTITCKTSLDGGSPVTGPTVYEVGTTGVYYISLTSSLTNGSCLAIIPSTTTSDIILPLIQIDFDDYALQSDVSSVPASVWSQSTRSLTNDVTLDSTQYSALTSALSSIQSSLGSLSNGYGTWSLDNGTLTIYDAESTRSMTLTVEKDQNGNITRIF